jgi:hypothetical protein
MFVFLDQASVICLHNRDASFVHALVTNRQLLNDDSEYIYTNRKMNTMIDFLETNGTKTKC